MFQLNLVVSGLPSDFECQLFIFGHYIYVYPFCILPMKSPFFTTWHDENFKSKIKDLRIIFFCLLFANVITFTFIFFTNTILLLSDNPCHARQGRIGTVDWPPKLQSTGGHFNSSTGGPCISWFLVPKSNQMRGSWIPRTVFSIKPQNVSKKILKSTFWAYFSWNFDFFPLSK